jgi:hypothetical protein
MYVLEHRIIVKRNNRIRCCWKEYVLCERYSPLSKVLAGQPDFSDWRIVYRPCFLDDLMKKLSHTA